MEDRDLQKAAPAAAIKELLAFCAEEYGGNPAFLWREKRQDYSVCFRDFQADVEALGSYLFHVGFREGSAAILGENRYEWVLFYFAAVCGGLAVASIEGEAGNGLILRRLRESGSRLLIYSDSYAEIAEQIQERMPEVACLNMGEAARFLEEGQELLRQGYSKYDAAVITQRELAGDGTKGWADRVRGLSLLMLPLYRPVCIAGICAVMRRGQAVFFNQSSKRALADLLVCRPQNIMTSPAILEMLHQEIWSRAARRGNESRLRRMIGMSERLRGCGVDLRRWWFRAVRAALGGNLEVIFCPESAEESEVIRDFEAWGVKVYWEEETTGI